MYDRNHGKSVRWSAKTVRLFVKCMAAERDVAAFELGVFETCCRQYTAKRRKDKGMEEAQKKHKKALISECAGQKKIAIEAWLALLAHMKNDSLVGRPVPDPGKFLEKIRQSGFPEAEVKLLKANGVTDQQIEDFRQWMLKSYVQSAPKSFEEGVLNANRACGQHRYGDVPLR